MLSIPITLTALMSTIMRRPFCVSERILDEPLFLPLISRIWQKTCWRSIQSVFIAFGTVVFLCRHVPPPTKMPAVKRLQQARFRMAGQNR